MPLRNLLVIGLTVAISMACYSVAAKNRYANLFAEAMDVIDQKSLRVIPREKLFVSAMNGMMEDLDEHSMFFSGELFSSFDEDIKQEFGGVGMYVESDPNTKRLFVLAPMPNTPAYEAGLRAGDQILTIDGEPTEGKSRRDAVNLLRGPVGKTVKLEVERKGEKMEKSLKRAVIPVASVHGDYRDAQGNWKYLIRDESRIGYVRLIQFGEKSAEEMAKAFLEVGDEIDGLIIDLRNNSGGLLSVAIDICDMLLPKDLAIVRTRGRNKVLEDEYFSTSTMVLKPSVPIVVLVNRNSASASEIVAGCLQDHQRAVIIGEQTWGKGTVQNVIPIQRGESALKLTTASYWRPSGKHIDRNDDEAKQTKKWGVQPNEGFEIELTEESVFQNIRQRNIRDLHGLLTPEESQVVTQMRRLEEPTDPPSGPTEDVGESGSDDDAQGNESESQIDLPLQRAIEYFQTRQKRPQIAA